MGTLKHAWFHHLPKDGEVFTFIGSTLADQRAVVALAESGLIRNDTERFAFDQVRLACEKLERGELVGRAVVRP